jgi:NitT/TauT family transport system substrate-binding protein
MNLRALAVFYLLIAPTFPAAAQEHVSVGTSRLIANGALFLADARGYFRAEGLEVAMTAYPTPQSVVEGLAGGNNDFALASFTAAAFTLAGQGKIKAVAAQVRERRGYEGNEIVASIGASDGGLRRLEHLANRAIAITETGSLYHYQLGQIARLKSFNLASITVKPMQSVEQMARAVITGQADAAILPALFARELLISNQARLVGWYSELDEQQLGALFVSAAVLSARRATVEKFIRAYKRGAADYATALLRHDRFGKRVSDTKSQEAAATIARYVYPGKPASDTTPTVEAGAYFMDAQARLEIADLERQIDWYKAQGLLDGKVEAKTIVDLSFIR